MAESAGAEADAVALGDSVTEKQRSQDDQSGRTVETKWAELAEDAVPAPGEQHEIEPPTWQPDDMPWWLTDALAQIEAKNSTPGAQPARQKHRETSVDAETRRDEFAAMGSFPIAEEETSNGIEAHSGDFNSMLFSVIRDDLDPARHRASHDDVATPAEPANGKQSRLSGLRRVVSPESLRHLQQARLPEDEVSVATPPVDRAASQPPFQGQPSPGSSRLSQLRGFVSTAGLHGIGQPKQPAPIDRPFTIPVHQATAERIPAEPALPQRPLPEPALTKQRPPEESQIPRPKPDSSLTGPSGNSEPIEVSKSLPSEVEFLRAQLAAANPRDRRDTWGPIQILPSRRGQYRKTD
jgi:hypothetical protein